MIRILNEIKNVNICGENDNAIINILKFYVSIKTTINFRKSYKNSSNITDFDKDKLCPAWYNSFDYDMIVNKIKDLIITILKKNDCDTLIGFKEIRFYDNLSYLDYFIELFPNTKIIIHLRNDILKQSKSDFYIEHGYSIEYLNSYNKQLYDYYENNKHISYLSTFENMFNFKELKKIFGFIGCFNSFNTDKIKHILNNKYDEIYWRYNDLLPKDFNVDEYKKLNPDLLHMISYDLKKHYIEHGIDENRKYKENNIKKEQNICTNPILTDNNNNNNNNTQINLPYDFNTEMYKKLNSDIDTYTDKELKEHYILYGRNENKPYKLIIPDDFNVELYRELNKDISHLSDIELKKHYMLFGKNEKRMYKFTVPNDFNIIEYKKIFPKLINLSDEEVIKHYNYSYDKTYKIKLPDDFDVNEYRKLNKDIEIMSDLELKEHYMLYGCNENRLYKLILPDTFIPKMYFFMNPDLYKLDDLELSLHYAKYGVHEKRLYKDIYFVEKDFCFYNNFKLNDKNNYEKYIKDVRQLKNKFFIKKNKKNLKKIDNVKLNNVILLVNHDDTYYGASHYLYLLFLILKNKFTKYVFKLVEINYNEILNEKYNIQKNDVLEYLKDPTLLYLIYKNINPLLIYFNSANHAFYHIIKHIPTQKMILHSHEILEHYLLSNLITPTFVVSDKICNLYIKQFNTKPLIQQPFIDNLDDIFKKSDEIIIFDEIHNSYNTFDKNKITICMCGQITNRKNYKLFIEIAKKYIDYNFLWIGGNKNDEFEKVKNIYHVYFTNNPYKYYKQLVDYFILFSTIDPCPFVVLENILLNTNVITFEKNIFYDHKNETINYYEYPDKINFINCCDAINIYVKNKKIINNNNNNGLIYIKKYFEIPINMINYISKILL
jgi:hypothetical protein